MKNLVMSLMLVIVAGCSGMGDLNAMLSGLANLTEPASEPTNTYIDESDSKMNQDKLMMIYEYTKKYNLSGMRCYANDIDNCHSIDSPAIGDEIDVIYDFGERHYRYDEVYSLVYVDTKTGEIQLTLVIKDLNATDQDFPMFNKAVFTFDDESITFIKDDMDKKTYSNRTVIKFPSASSPIGTPASESIAEEMLCVNYHESDFERITRLVNAKNITFSMYFGNPKIKPIENIKLTPQDQEALKKTMEYIADIQLIIKG